MEIPKEQNSSINDVFVKDKFVNDSVNNLVKMRFVNSFIMGTDLHNGIKTVLSLESQVVQAVKNDSKVNNEDMIRQKLDKLIDIQYERFVNWFFEKKKRELFRLNEDMFNRYVEREILTLQVGLKAYSLKPFIFHAGMYWFIGEII